MLTIQLQGFFLVSDDLMDAYVPHAHAFTCSPQLDHPPWPAMLVPPGKP